MCDAETQPQSGSNMESSTKRKSNPPKRTYSKRALGNNQDFSIKRQRIDSSESKSTSPSSIIELNLRATQIEDTCDSKNSSPSITSFPEHFQENFSTITSTSNSRISPSRSIKSVSPLDEVKANEQFRRVESLINSDSPGSSNLIKSAKRKALNVTSIASTTASVCDSIYRLQKIPGGSTITFSSLNPNTRPLKSSSRRDFASNKASPDSDLGEPDDSTVTTLSPKELLTAPSIDVNKEDCIVSAKSTSTATIKKSSIRSYFKPLPPPSNPSTPQSLTLSNQLQPSITSPPSSPPLSATVQQPITSKSKRVRRRLSTKPKLPNLTTMSSSDLTDGMTVDEIAGDLSDPSRVPLLEAHYDREERRSLDGHYRNLTPMYANPGTAIHSQSAASFNARNVAITQDGTSTTATQRPSAAETFHLTDAQLSGEGAKPIPILGMDGANAATLRRTQSRGYTQQILDLGQTVHTECKGCGMHYTMTITEEKLLHDKFHKLFHEGSLSKINLTPIFIFGKVMHIDNLAEEHKYYRIDCNSTLKFKDLAENVLEATLHDMDGALPTSSQLWSCIPNPNSAAQGAPEPRYKLFLHTISTRLVAVLLAERIGVAEPNALAAAAGVLRKEVYMSVDRIWVHKDHRGRRLGARLVDVARGNFIPGLQIGKEMVAVSQPTSLGKKFFGSYFRGVFGGEGVFMIGG